MESQPKVNVPAGPIEEVSTASTTHFRKGNNPNLDRLKEFEDKAKLEGLKSDDRLPEGEVLFKLLIHSIAMFSIPILAFYFVKDIAETRYDVTTPRSYMYGTVAGVISVQVIIASYVFIAFFERENRRIPEKNKSV